ncbi:odorant receptor Or2-like, partial [Zootermopsis nevadensis]|uniref:odorant receptor Or2-like n=1 Tax=Zootermopsis nevadensis TaxID=136037 RepID=UPI000B8ECDB0
MAVLANRPLSYNGWYPFDVSVSPTYELVNFTQLLGALTYDCTIFGFSALYATFICIACSQLEKLRTSLLDIRQNRDISKDSGAETDQEEEGKVNASGEMFQRMQKQLNDCVRHHQQILSYIRVLEETTNPVMAGNFLLSLVCMCFASFSIVTSWGNYIQMSQGVLSFGAVLTALFIYSWFANELTDQ